MKRFLPNSLLGQVMLVLAGALLVAQAISAILLYRAADAGRQEALVNAVTIRIVAASYQRGERPSGEERQRMARLFDGERARALGRVERSEQSPIGRDERRLASLETALKAALAEQEIPAGDVAVTRRRVGDDPFIQQRRRNAARPLPPRWADRMLLIAAIERPDLGIWQAVRVAEPRPPRAIAGGVLLQTTVTFIVLVAALFLVLRRITRPLARLTQRVDDFASKPGEALALEERGPADMRRLIAAHNAMEARIAAMLNEKDVMLGAIGHDLKTPLAALRVRVESVADEAQRARMAEGIEEITRSLDDILNLARVGRANEPLEPTSLTALAASVVEEYEDMGEPVELLESAKVVAPVRATWLRAALRNLIGNALRYAGSAKVVVREEDGMAVLRVIDSGPGIPEERIEALLEPFARGEESRNRATGGTGLGLTLARAVAQQHGGALSLSNRDEGGLRAEIRLPL